MADVTAEIAPQEPEQEPAANENGKISSKSSDISIEEIGPEEVTVEKVEDAEVLIPEEPSEKVEQLEPEKIEEVEVKKVEVEAEAKTETEPEKAEKVEPAKEIIEEIPREPEVSASVVEDDDEEDEDDDDDDFDDETILERLMALTEMFPESLTNAAGVSASGVVSGLKWAYSASKVVTWVVCTSASIMFLPIMIETERLGIEEAQKQQQRQILLGPGAAMSGGNAQVNAPLPAAMS